MPATRIGCSLHNDTKFRLRSAALSRASVVAVPTDDVARRADSAARPYAPDARSRIWSILLLADFAAALRRAPACPTPSRTASADSSARSLSSPAAPRAASPRSLTLDAAE